MTLNLPDSIPQTNTTPIPQSPKTTQIKSTGIPKKCVLRVRTKNLSFPYMCPIQFYIIVKITLYIYSTNLNPILNFPAIYPTENHDQINVKLSSESANLFYRQSRAGTIQCPQHPEECSKKHFSFHSTCSPRRPRLALLDRSWRSGRDIHVKWLTTQ